MEVTLFTENYQLNDKKAPTFTYETNLDQSIKKIVKKEGYINYKIDKKLISTNGGNYLGELYAIDVKGTTKDGDKELNIFVKNATETESCKIISLSTVYDNENFVYKELSKLFNDLQERANVPIDERYKMVKAYEESNSKAIILENVTKRGFTTYNRMDIMSLNYVEMCVKQLAKFHGLSFVIKETMPKYFASKIKPLKYTFNFNEEWLNMCKCVKEIGLNNVDEVYRDKLEKVYDNLVTKYPQYVNDETIKTCLCHGDYRPNNIMTKINDDGEATDIIPVDYQLIYYGCPVFDFLYLLYSCTDKKFRRSHASNLKDLYYETLTTFLGYFDLDANMVYPRIDFEKVYKEKHDQGLMIALVILPFILVSEDDVPDVTKEMSDLTFKVDDKFKGRVREVIEDFIEWGWM